MSTKLRSITAMAAACTLIMGAVCSCGSRKEYAPKGDYRKDEHKNNNVIEQPRDEEPECYEGAIKNI